MYHREEVSWSLLTRGGPNSLLPVVLHIQEPKILYFLFPQFIYSFLAVPHGLRVVPGLEIEPMPPAMEAWNPNH